MNRNFGTAAPGGETGCAATVVAVSAGAVDSSGRRGKRCRGFVVDFCGRCSAPGCPARYVMWLPLTGCGDLDLLPVGDGAHPDSGPNRDPADGPCGHDDRGVNHA